MLLTSYSVQKYFTFSVRECAVMSQEHEEDVSYARLDVFTRGVVWGMYVAGATREDMLKHVVKMGV